MILVIGLLITWLLASSIGVLIKLNESKAAQGGGSLNIHVNLPQPVITLPPINITIPQHVNETRGAELYVPLIPLPIVMPNIPINITRYIVISTPRPPQPWGGGGYSGTSGLQEGSGNSQQYVSNTVAPLRIPPLLVIIVIITAIIIISISSLTIVRREIHGSSQLSSNTNVNVKSNLKINVVSKGGSDVHIKLSREVELLPGGEVVKVISGWGGGNDIIDLGIPRDLPLIWRFNEPLPIIIKGGVLWSLLRDQGFLRRTR